MLKSKYAHDFHGAHRVVAAAEAAEYARQAARKERARWQAIAPSQAMLDAAAAAYETWQRRQTENRGDPKELGLLMWTHMTSAIGSAPLLDGDQPEKAMQAALD